MPALVVNAAIPAVEVMRPYVGMNANLGLLWILKGFSHF
jgi:hypothetical protein